MAGRAPPAWCLEDEWASRRSDAQWTGTYTGPTDAGYLTASSAFDTTGFANPIAGSFGWSLDSADRTLLLTYTPSAVPEPGTLALLAVAGGGWLARQRFFRRCV